MESDTIDLLKLFRLFRRKAWLIILFVVIGIAVSGAFTVYFIPKLYSADVLMYIWQDQEDKQSANLTAGDLNLFTQLVSDYQVLMKSRLVTQAVAVEMQMPAKQAAALASQIVVGTKANTRHITLTVRDESPQQAAAIANTVARVFAATVIEKMGAGKVQVIDAAEAPKSPSSPNVKMNIVLGALIGLMLAAGLILLIEFLDVTVRTVDDVTELTGYTLLGTVPLFESKDMVGNGRRK